MYVIAVQSQNKRDYIPGLKDILFQKGTTCTYQQKPNTDSYTKGVLAEREIWEKLLQHGESEKETDKAIEIQLALVSVTLPIVMEGCVFPPDEDLTQVYNERKH